MEELRIVVNQELGTISTNFEEVKTEFTNQMQVYKELEVTEENKTERKKDIATLRKISKAVDDKRKEVKVECMKPYEVFETKAKELIAIIEEPIKLIDFQVKEFDEAKRLEKVAEIKVYFQEIIGEDLEECISLNKIYDTKWENVSASMKSVKEELSTKVESIRAGANLIKNMRSEKEVQALDTLYETLDVTKAITLINNYEQQKKEIEERLKREAEFEAQRKAETERKEKERILEEERAKVRKEEQDRIAAEIRIATEEREKLLAEQKAKEQEQIEAMSVKKSTQEAEMSVYMITATVEEFAMLEMYMESIGVEYQKGE